MRRVTGALAATRLFDGERAEVRTRRKARRVERMRQITTVSATHEKLGAAMVEPGRSPLGQTPPVRTSGSE